MVAGSIVLRYVESPQNRADMLTKALRPTDIKKANAMMFKM